MTNSFEKDIALNIRKYRKACHLTQESLAEKIGLTVRMISLIENNKVGLNCKTITKIAHVFHIEPYKLTLPADYLESDTLSPELKRLVQLAQHIPADKIELLILLLHTWQE